MTVRLLSALRPYICPFEPIVRFCPAGSRVIDIGCGNGAVLGLLGALGRLREGIGCDISERAISATESAVARQPGVPLRFLRVTDFSKAPTGPFDVVITVDVLHHIAPARQREFIEALALRVASGGRLIVKDMVTRPLWRRWANGLHDLIVARQLVNHVPMGRVEDWARGAGLDLIHSEHYNRFIYGHELRVFVRP